MTRKNAALIERRLRARGVYKPYVSMDGETRRRAALKVPIKVRKMRAQAAANKCRGTHHALSYHLSLDDATGLLGVDNERVVGMSREGLIRTCYRGGRIKVSAADVAEYIALQSGAAKRRPMDERAA